MNIEQLYRLQHEQLKIINSLRDDVRELREEIKHLKDNPAPSPDDSGALPRLNIFIAKQQNGGRFPYAIHFDGVLTGIWNCSDSRIPILLVLFKDLQNRYDGGPGIANTRQQIQNVFTGFGVGKSKAAIHEALSRVQGDFCKKTASREFTFHFNSRKNILEVQDRAKKDTNSQALG